MFENLDKFKALIAQTIKAADLTVTNYPRLGPLGLSVPHVSTLAEGPPGAPTHNQFWIATDVDTDGTCWQFRYNGNSTSTLKWEFIGGSPIYEQVVTDETTTSTTLTAAGFTGLSITPTKTADYVVEWGFNGYNSVGASNVQMGIGIGGAAPAATETIFSSTPGTNLAANYMRRQVVNVTAQNQLLAEYAVSSGTGHFRDRWLTITPVRIA